MLPFLPPAALGVVTFAVMFVNLAFWGTTISLLAPLKLLPHAGLRRATGRAAVRMAGCWVAISRLIHRGLHGEPVQVNFSAPLHAGRNYLLVCNHQSWADIMILFHALHGHAPLPRFFLKHDLLYVPFIGSACWVMDFPFMKRHSREAIAANPALRDEDLRTTRRACEIYRHEPVTVVNFLEGTRFTEAKRRDKQSPYQRLLRPKTAGLAFTLQAMGEQFAGLVDVTLAYARPGRTSLFWDWLCGEVRGTVVQVELLPLPADLLKGDYDRDAAYRSHIQNWVNALWARKDERLGQALTAAALRPAAQA